MQYYEVYLSFGSSVGDRKANIETSLGHLNDSGVKSKKISSLYETEPWGNIQQPAFLNMAGIFETTLAPRELMTEILIIERLMGRERSKKWQPRIIDIDILFFGNKIINETELVIPHPELHKRKFVLIPLTEIAPDFFHPAMKMPVMKLMTECTDMLTVNKV